MVRGVSGSDLFGVVLVVVGLVVLAFSARYVWRASAVFRATTIRSLDDTTSGTLVRASGTALSGSTEPFTAPFSGVECLALRYEVEERRLSPLVLPWFVTIHGTAGSDAFAINTSRATLPVSEPAHTVVLERGTVATVSSNGTLPERIARFEANTSITERTIWRNPPRVLQPVASALSLGTRRYTEQRATIGDDVTVVGRVTTEGTIDPLVVSDRTPIRTLLRMARTSIGGLAIGVFSLLVGGAALIL